MTDSELQGDPVLTSGFVRDALSGQVKLISTSFEKSKKLGKICIDSRILESADLFVAMKGEVFDGHEFISKAVLGGCRAVICEKYPADVTQEGVDIFLVSDTLASFRCLSRAWREHLDPRVIAVAGSVGKTTTKDLLTALVKTRGQDKVHFTTGSQNGFVGLPLTLVGLRASHETAIFEVGIDAPGAMAQHIDIVRPDIAIVTAISEEHLEWLKNLETIAFEENMILRETAQAGGVAVVNLDDYWIAPLWTEIRSHSKVGFTLKGQGGPNVLAGRIVNEGLGLEVFGMGQGPFMLDLPLPGDHNARNLLGAVAVALLVGVKPQDMPSGLKSFKSSGGRSELQMSSKGVGVLCDYYNANPASMRAAFNVAREQLNKSGAGKRVLWLCLADMKELGVDEESLHRQLSASIIGLPGVVHVYLFGERMKWLEEELVKNRFSGQVKNFDSQDDLASALALGVNPGDFVVLKGSNSMKMSKVWELIK
ncbi:MAG: UDP-N-acetylmuramoyl-tripeptide--D-alanyl-D-alanine ligase [Proteobacteria bacterium]|nr:UDP-N-acetylmuramoyl-tripeptide--D-alanyl-D-alanine ligase [Pseudomonadota bacterium]